MARRRTLITNFNKSSILNLIRNMSPIYKAEIARITALSIPTVMKITDEFIEKGLVTVVGKGESSGGKPPLMLEFNPNAYYIVGIEIRTKKIKTSLINLNSKIIKKNDKIIEGIPTPHELITMLIDAIHDVMDQAHLKPACMLGIGIGMHGLVNKVDGLIIYDPDWGWKDIDIVNPISQHFGIKVVIDNVNRAYAMSERLFGIARNIDNFTCVYLGYGIGSASFINGELCSGSSGTYGEIGHFTLQKDGPLCDCGNQGCLEALSSSYAIVRNAHAALKSGRTSKILDLAGGNLENLNAWHVWDAAKLEDPLALEITHNAIEYLGIALAGIINFIDPELIILEGEYSHLGDILIKNLKEVVKRYCLKSAGRHARIVASRTGDAAASVGAGAFLLETFIEHGGEVPEDIKS